MARRSTASVGSSVGAPWTWQRKPSSAYLSARTTPDFASRKLAKTSWVLLPIDETMPIPVTTTRLITASSASCAARAACAARLRAARLFGFAQFHQADLEVHGPVDDRTVGRKPAVGDAKHHLRAHHALDVDAVDDLLDVRQHLAGEFQFAKPQRPPPPGRTDPAQKE